MLRVTRLTKEFYQRFALEAVKDFLGKYLVLETIEGRLSGKIIDVEAYPAFVDKVSHAKSRTKRTEILFGEGSFAYVYLIYGKYHQFAVVVNKREVPEVVFIRAIIPEEGISIMKKNFDEEVHSDKELTKSPGNLCKSFGIDLSFYGADLVNSNLYLEDHGIEIKPAEIVSAKRIGINSSLEGHAEKFRFYIKP